MRLSQQNHFTLKAFAIGILFLLQGFLCDAQQKKLVADELHNLCILPAWDSYFWVVTCNKGGEVINPA